MPVGSCAWCGGSLLDKSGFGGGLAYCSQKCEAQARALGGSATKATAVVQAIANVGSIARTAISLLEARAEMQEAEDRKLALSDLEALVDAQQAKLASLPESARIARLLEMELHRPLAPEERSELDALKVAAAEKTRAIESETEALSGGAIESGLQKLEADKASKKAMERLEFQTKLRALAVGVMCFVPVGVMTALDLPRAGALAFFIVLVGGALWAMRAQLRGKAAIRAARKKAGLAP